MAFKRLIVTNILATDMAKHNKQVIKIGKRAKATIANKEKIMANEEIDGPIKDLVLLSERAEDRRVRRFLV